MILIHPAVENDIEAICSSVFAEERSEEVNSLDDARENSAGIEFESKEFAE